MIKAHPWFKPIDFKLLVEKEITPPYIPPVKSKVRPFLLCSYVFVAVGRFPFSVPASFFFRFPPRPLAAFVFFSLSLSVRLGLLCLVGLLLSPYRLSLCCLTFYLCVSEPLVVLCLVRLTYVC